MISGIYLITCKANGRVYIGSTQDWKHRLGVHRSQLRRNSHHNVHLQRAWDKYGDDLFTFEFVKEVAVSDLLATEQEWFTKFTDRFNIADTAGAPMRGVKHTSEARSKMSKAHLADPSRFTRNRGRKASVAAKEKMSLARKGKPIPALQGRKLTEEHKAKISPAGRPYIRKSAKHYTWHKHHCKWMVTVRKQFHGYFATEEEAAAKVADVLAANPITLD